MGSSGGSLMALPGNVLSTTQRPAPFLSPDDRVRTDLTDFELGGVALNDASQGSEVQAWALTYADPDIIVTPETIGDPSTVIQVAGCTEISLAFDQNMQPLIAYVVGGQAKFYWFDSLLEDFTTSDLEANALSPRCGLDDKRFLQTGTSDVILAYILDTKLVYRQQRDRYGIVRELYGGLDNETLYTVGMNTGNQFQFSYITSDPV
jgi:hypothetical protein